MFSISLIIFCTATLFTPGPNNFMLMASGFAFGLKKSIPHILGVTFGFSALTLLVGLGLGKIFLTYPSLYTLLKFGGGFYILYLAYLTIRAGAITTNGQSQRSPLTFFQACMFQLVNPKGWMMAVSGTSAFEHIAIYPMNMFVISGTFCALGLLSSLAWASGGTYIQPFLTSPSRAKIFNYIMGSLLVLSIIPIFID